MENKASAFDIDVERLAMAKVAYDWSKKILEEPKELFRAGKIIPKNDYISIGKPLDYTTSKYTDEDQAKIDKFCLENGITKQKFVTPNHVIKYAVTEEAIQMFKRALSAEGVDY